VLNRKAMVMAVALVCAPQVPALGAEAGGDLAGIRNEIKQMREAYEKRIADLEKRLNEAETKAGKAETAASRAEQSAGKAESAAVAASSAGGAGRTGENTFNPAMSLILQGTFARSTRDPGQYQITGYVPSGGEVGPPKRSFGLSET